jgi:hypothetical protein
VNCDWRFPVAVLGFSLCFPQARLDAQQSLDAVLDRATAYVASFVQQFSSVVAEERYIQEEMSPAPSPAKPTEGQRLQLLRPELSRRRDLRSDLLLVKLDGTDGWQVFRDVFVVDGKQVRDREDRLTRLFVEPQPTAQAVERAKQIMNEGARYHVGPIGTVDNPLLAFTFLQASARHRFRFVTRGTARIDGLTTRVIEFVETAQPTMVRTGGDGDIFARGRYWIAPDTGQIARTEVTFLAPNTQSTVTTNFRPDSRFGIFVPTEMRFRRSVPNSEITCVASYGTFRQFQVNSEWNVGTR